VKPGTHVTFWDGPVGTGVNLGTGIVIAGGTATINTTALAVGTNTINAVFVDDDDATVEFASSTGTLSNYLVSQAATTTTVSANPPSGAVFGQPVDLTATITSPTATVPIGTHV